MPITETLKEADQTTREESPKSNCSRQSIDLELHQTTGISNSRCSVHLYCWEGCWLDHFSLKFSYWLAWKHLYCHLLFSNLQSFVSWPYTWPICPSWGCKITWPWPQIYCQPADVNGSLCYWLETFWKRSLAGHWFACQIDENDGEGDEQHSQLYVKSEWWPKFTPMEVLAHLTNFFTEICRIFRAHKSKSNLLLYQQKLLTDLLPQSGDCQHR